MFDLQTLTFIGLGQSFVLQVFIRFCMGKINILIVDDSEDNRKLLSSLIVKSGNTCETAENGKEAIDKLIENKYDLIFMDLNMPIMTGDAATRFIRSKLPFPKNRIKIIAITAHNYSEFFDDFRDVGFNDIINKPYTIQKIKDIINYQNIISVY